VRDLITPEHRAARLLVGETLNPAGNWSSAPPHKHDRSDPPHEAELEEIYCFRLSPATGFGLQHSYTVDPPAERTFAVHDLDVVTIPAGYHPVVACPGHELYYLWGLAGEGRALRWQTDPQHRFVDAP
jgi:5-deoxy-glucuronate isomerase